MQATPKPQNKYWLCFGLCALGAGCLFLPFLLVDKGFFLYAGDFNSQQIPFYYYANAFLKQGGGSFSWATDLGSGFANSYSFYHLGSPFFWLSLLFPAAWIPFLMAPLLVLKFAVAGGGAYLWAHRHTKSANMAVLAGCLYAFSGFTIYNVFFNHFVDVIALFPYLLWALDGAVLHKRRGAFAFFVALNFLNSYFFFAGQVVFLALYFGCMVAAKQYRPSKKTVAALAFESLVGTAMGSALALPALYSLAENPRVTDVANGFGLLLYGKVQQYFAIVYSLFFPPDCPYMPVVFTEGSIKWTSLSAYLPLFSMVGGIAYLRCKKGTAFKWITLACLGMALVPGLNSLFYMLNASYYARWFYMPILVLCCISVLALEDPAIQIQKGLAPTVCVLLGFTAFALVPTKVGDAWRIGAMENPEKFWLSFAMALLGVAIFSLLVQQTPRREKLAQRLVAGVLAFGCVYGVLHIAIGKFAQWDNDFDYRAQQYQDARALQDVLPQGAYRIDAYACYDNTALWSGLPTLQCFNSTVAPSILQFYPAVDVTRDVRSEPDVAKYALRSLLGVRFAIVPQQKQEEFLQSTQNQWEYWGQQGQLAIYENTQALPLAFGVQGYVTAQQFTDLNKLSRGNLLLRALVLQDDQIPAFAPYAQPLTDFDISDNTAKHYETDLAACQQLLPSAVALDANGITAQFDLQQPTPILFSVPWDKGFSATINGAAAPLHKVDEGLMAVIAPAGGCEIRLGYKTYGLAQGLALSAAGVLLWGGYCAACAVQRRKKAAKPTQ